LRLQFERAGQDRYIDLPCQMRLCSFGIVLINSWKGHLAGASL